MKEIESNNLIRKKLADTKTSPLQTYKNLTVGEGGFGQFFLYELLTFFLGPLPGGVGFYLRKKFYPLLFKKVGRGVIIGRNVVLRHPGNIIIGDNVTIDDNCLIDARGAGSAGVVFEDNVMLNRNCMVQAKAGPIQFGKRTTIGSNSVVVSMDGVELGEAVLVAGSCYVSAGAYHFDDVDRPVMDQGVYTKGPIVIGNGCWIGTRVTILDGVNIGGNTIIGAGSVVTKNIPAKSIAYGVPSIVGRSRR